ncbi:MAG: Flp pilus assembly complex ATPase component TadA [Deltaproteobacteria bacterium]|nr:Flp pilus assembly complex ATPase component TadA [Deltaproteobacteria bacterium]
MAEKLIINLKNGQSLECFLARAFTGTDSDINVIIQPEQKRLVFALDEIAYILMAGTPSWVAGRQPTSVERVQTITGATFSVAIYENLHFTAGFFGIAVGTPPVSDFETIFFVNSAIRYRHLEKAIGKILQDKGFVTHEKISEVLKVQEELRNRRVGELLSESANVPQEIIEKTLQKAQTDSRSKARVGDILIEAGLVTKDQVEKALASQISGRKVRIGELLIANGLITEDQLLNALATKFQMRFVDLAALTPSEEALAALSEGLVNRLHVFPLEIDGNRLVVATSAPTNPAIGDDLRFCTKYSIDLVVASSAQITQAIERHYLHKNDEVDTIFEEMKAELNVTVEEDVEASQFIEPDSKVITLINRILIDAHKRGASDIHFEPGGGSSPVTVRYRIDGECLEAHKIAATFKNAIISRIKIIANLDITERRKPQSGKIMLRFENRKVEYRVEITPTVGNQEDAVLRLLAASKPLPLEEMGFLPYNLERLKEIVVKPYGIILCVGPTGSGKTTTLHAALGYINKPTRKIWTAEDPVEITQAGLRQVQVNPRIGFSFAEAMRSFLRADPDVIMIGEMRDAETAKIAIEASLTGHQVFSTLHTNSAPETVVRLIDMGMDRLNFADALLGIVAQRLARKLCGDCKRPARFQRGDYDEMRQEFLSDASPRTAELFPDFESVVFMNPVGCQQCNNTGYKGRVALHELLLGTPVLKNAIKQGCGGDELKRIAVAEGMITLKMDGILKVLCGITNMEQVLKVCI